MPSAADLRPNVALYKGLHLGLPGAGKTGVLPALANAGYRVACIDFDNGLPIISSYLTPEGAARFYYETLTDRMAAAGSVMSWVGEPKAFPTSIRLMSDWNVGTRKIERLKPDGSKETIEVPGYKLGPVSSWGAHDVLVIDSITMQGAAIMRYNLFLQGKQMDEERKLHPYQSDWGEAQNRQQAVLEYLYSSEVKCNVIVNAHIKRQGGGGMQGITDKLTGQVTLREIDTDEGKGLPTALGKALPPKVGSYFNTQLLFETDRNGLRWIHTDAYDNIDCKTPCPNLLNKRYELSGENFLTIFETIRGERLGAARK